LARDVGKRRDAYCGATSLDLLHQPRENGGQLLRLCEQKSGVADELGVPAAV
jgi:hypothetical protein